MMYVGMAEALSVPACSCRLMVPVRPLIAFLLLLAAPATAAAAPLLDPLKPCYVAVRTTPDAYTTESMVIGGHGFTPSSAVDVSIDGEPVMGLYADAAGALAGQLVPAPIITDGERPFSVTATERDSPYNLVTAASKVSALTVKVRPKRAAPSRRVRFHGRGFTTGGGIYAHYLRRNKLRKTVRLARTTEGDCGTFSVRRPQFPFRPRQGVWRVQVDQRKRLLDEGPLVNLTIDVRRRPL
jgi:hypothetical protein